MCVCVCVCVCVFLLPFQVLLTLVSRDQLSHAKALHTRAERSEGRELVRDEEELLIWIFFF